MEEQAPYDATTADRRELVAPVAAWLATLGFQHVVVDSVPDLNHVELMAGWETPEGVVYHFTLKGYAEGARCFFFEHKNNRMRVLLDWFDVQALAEVQWLLARCRCFQRARAGSAGASLLAAGQLPGSATAPPEEAELPAWRVVPEAPPR